MIPTLSICIPTLNRPELLLQSLNSIFSEPLLFKQLEICISNNCSDADYAIVDARLADYASLCNIKYVRHTRRLPLDENHHYVKRMATSKYIYFLGDDDFFLDDQLPLLLDLVEREAPDLAIFNGIFVDEHDKVVGPHFDLPALCYSNFSSAFIDLRDKGMFGAVLVKAEHLDDEKFRCLFGTSHGYGCFWFALMSNYSSQQSPIVMIPTFPLVALRVGVKNYDNLRVYFRDILYEIAVYQRYLPSGLPQQLNEKFRVHYLKKISSVMFLTRMRNSNIDIKNIKNINPGFYRKYRLKIAVSEVFARIGAYDLLKKIYRSLFQKKQSVRLSAGEYFSDKSCYFYQNKK